MVYALILPEEKIENYMAVVQVSYRPFEVAPPLFWKEGPDDLFGGKWGYDPETDQLIQVVQTIEKPTVNDSGTTPNVII